MARKSKRPVQYDLPNRNRESLNELADAALHELLASLPARIVTLAQLQIAVDAGKYDSLLEPGERIVGSGTLKFGVMVSGQAIDFTGQLAVRLVHTNFEISPGEPGVLLIARSAGRLRKTVTRRNRSSGEQR